MNPLLHSIVIDLAHGEPASALPGAPVVDDTPRAAAARRRVGAALHAVARAIEPNDARRVEPVRYRTA
jgi:hypothetical protein